MDKAVYQEREKDPFGRALNSTRLDVHVLYLSGPGCVLGTVLEYCKQQASG